jgi:ketopantoate reductase
MQKRVGVIGTGGKTGTMFAFELKEVAPVIGIGKDIDDIQKKKLFVKRNNTPPQLFDGKTIQDIEFLTSEFLPEILFLTTKNPIGPTIKYYYKRIKEYTIAHQKPYFPTLVLSQNGIVAGENAISALKEVFGKDYKKVKVVRLILLNPIDGKKIDDKTHITYSLPIRVGFSKISGPGDLQDIISLFKEASFKIKEFPLEEAKDLEFSKLFLNLIGMASATHGSSIEEGFKRPEIFKEEVKAIKEYIKVVKAQGGNFIDLFDYKISLLARIFETLPVGFFLLFRNYLAGLMSKGRKGKVKSLTEIEYYNGAVVNLGEKAAILTPVNKKILERGS